jgi:hypothetical protein
MSERHPAPIVRLSEPASETSWREVRAAFKGMPWVTLGQLLLSVVVPTIGNLQGFVRSPKTCIARAQRNAEKQWEDTPLRTRERLASAIQKAGKDPALLLRVLRGMIESGFVALASELTKSTVGVAYYNSLTEVDRQYPLTTMIVGMRSEASEMSRALLNVGSYIRAFEVPRARGFEARARTALEAIAQLGEGQYKDGLDLLVRLNLALAKRKDTTTYRTLGQKTRYIRECCPEQWRDLVPDDVVGIRNAAAHNLYEFDLSARSVLLYADDERQKVKATYTEQRLQAILDQIAETAVVFSLAAYLRTLDNTALALQVADELGIESLTDIDRTRFALKLGLDRTYKALAGPRVAEVGR